MRRALLVLLACGAIAGATACSANSIIHNQAAWCVYHAWRLEKDIRHHHHGWAALQGILAAHHCSKALGL